MKKLIKYIPSVIEYKQAILAIAAAAGIWLQNYYFPLSMLEIGWWMGIYVLASGLMRIVSAFYDKHDSNSTFLEGNLETIIGFVIIFYPFLNLQVALTLIIVWALNKGIFHALPAFAQLKTIRGIALLINSLAALAAGVILLSLPVLMVETLMIFSIVHALTLGTLAVFPAKK